jgi:hypothetical protein
MHDYRPGRLWVAIGLLAAALLLGGCLSHVDAGPNRLTFSLPTTLSIDRGSTLMGTGILYDSPGNGGVYMIVDGQRALKRKGDSLSWSGSFIPETFTELDLRLVWNTEEKVDVVGTAQVVINSASPQVSNIVTSSPISFSGPVAYGIAKDSYIPGTTLTYLGEGESGAELGGLYNEYPYRQIGDSILWEGQLRAGVFLRMELRTVQFDRRGLRVAGVATLWLGE